jgi:hypothetical protein
VEAKFVVVDKMALSPLQTIDELVEKLTEGTASDATLIESGL